jgi:hypothetical protein
LGSSRYTRKGILIMIEYKIIVKTERDLVIEDLTQTLISAQEFFDIDLMPEIMAIAKKIGGLK